MGFLSCMIFAFILFSSFLAAAAILFSSFLASAAAVFSTAGAAFSTAAGAVFSTAALTGAAVGATIGSIIPGAGTLFFVNEEGYAITCKHIIEALSASENMLKIYNDFKSERDKLPKDGKFNTKLKGLELKYKYNQDSTVQMKSTFVECVDSISGYSGILHPKYDLAILKFNDYKSLLYKDYAVFQKDTNEINKIGWSVDGGLRSERNV